MLPRLQMICLAAALPGGFLRSAPVDFNRDVQPILSENCYACHGPDKARRKADLRLDVEREAKAKREGTTAIVPGHSESSEVYRRLVTPEADDLMPPPESKKKLAAAEIDTLKRWLDQGAPWGTHWAFAPLRNPPVPGLRNPACTVRNPIDAFVLARLEKEGISPSPEAPKETLIRRVTLDLTGLPPTPAEVNAFACDPSPQAYERVVDRLLKSPRYGERWCWDWLDAARYADTNGYQGDPERTMWPWRDWVTAAINDNMPYDRFTIWQIAGDLLPGSTIAQKLATGFNRNHMMNGEGGRIAEESRVENVMDRVETTATVWLGLTMGCSKCHDHKFDPFTMRDYYGLYDFFNQTSEDGGGRGGQAAPALDIATEAERARSRKAAEKFAAIAREVDAFERGRFGKPPGDERAALPEMAKLPGKLPQFLGRQAPDKRSVDNLLECIEQLKRLRDTEYAGRLEALLAGLRRKSDAANKVTKVMIMDTAAKPRDTFVLVKGAYDKPTDAKLTAQTPESLPRMDADAPRNRLGLAQWLVSRQNPLTSRVTVNRFWQSFFGTGLVKTVEDFGVQGEKPANPELLDWLATAFVESAWDVKALHKRIVMSATYRQSSIVTPRAYERDPENRLLSRGPRFRMPSWMLRDVALSASGLLKEQIGGPPVQPYQPEGIWEEATFGKKSYHQDHGDALYRRSLYTFWRRIVGPTMFFDNTSRQTCYVRAIRTNTPLHALTTLNDVQYVEAARALAQRVLLAEKVDARRLDLVFLLCVARPPKPEERNILLHRIAALGRQFRADPDGTRKLLAVGESKRDERIPGAEHAAWTALCQLVLNLDEAVTKE